MMSKVGKATVAVLALAAGSVAHADIEGISGSNTFNSDLVLTIYDSVLDLTYVQDLEVNYLDILNGGSFIESFDLDAGALSIFAGSNDANLSWSMIAAGQDFLLPGDQFGAITTAVAPFTLEFATLSQIATQFNQLAEAANNLMDDAVDGDVATSGTGSFLSGVADEHQVGISGQVGFSNAVGVDTAMSLYWLGTDIDFLGVAPRDLSGAQWELDLSGGTLSVSAVPLPAAAWLLLSGLLGLGAVSRRKV